MQAATIWDTPFPFDPPNPPAPFTIPPAGSITGFTAGTLSSQEACLAINRGQKTGDGSNTIDFTGHVYFDSGQALCTARLVCGAETQQTDGGPCGPNNPNCQN